MKKKKQRDRVRFTSRVRRNAVAAIVIAVIFVVILAVAYPIAQGASDTARLVVIIVWSSLLGLSYLAFIIYAVWEYLTNSIDVNKAENKRLKRKRKEMLREAQRRAEARGEELSHEEKERIESGYYDWTGLPDD